MTGKKLRPEDLPYWPRYLNLAMAAAYVGVAPATFTDEVRAGTWPPARPRGRQGGLATWDRALLDAAADHAAGLGPDESPAPLMTEELRRDFKERLYAATKKQPTEKGRPKIR